MSWYKKNLEKTDLQGKFRGREDANHGHMIGGMVAARKTIRQTTRGSSNISHHDPIVFGRVLHRVQEEHVRGFTGIVVRPAGVEHEERWPHDCPRLERLEGFSEKVARQYVFVDVCRVAP